MITRMTDRKGMKSGIQMPGRRCVHVENGRAIIPKICVRDYECGHCAFDQWIEEMEGREFSREDLSREKDFLANAA